MRVVLEPFIVRSGIEVVGPRIDSHLGRPQPMMEVLKLGMIRKEGEPLLGHLARAAQGSRVHDPPDLLDERLRSRLLLLELAGGTGLHTPNDTTGYDALPGSFTTAIPSSRNCFSSTSEGASVIRSVAEAVLGKAMTSRSELAPAMSITMRSRPRAMPPWGGAP